MTCEEMFERYELNLTQIALEDEHRFRCRQTRTKCLRARAMHGHLVIIARSAFSLRRDKTKPDNICPSPSLLLLRIIIDFCEEDLRVGTGQMPGGETSTKFGRSQIESIL